MAALTAVMETSRRWKIEAARTASAPPARTAATKSAGPAAPPSDLSERKASDYLPPDLKARLIAEGRLTPEGDPAPAAAAGSAVRTQSAGAAPAAASAAQPAAPPARQPEPLARRLLGKLLGFFASK